MYSLVIIAFALSGAQASNGTAVQAIPMATSELCIAAKHELEAISFPDPPGGWTDPRVRGALFVRCIKTQ